MKAKNTEELHQALVAQGCAIDEDILLGEQRAERIKSLVKPFNSRLMNNTSTGSVIISRTQYIPFPLAIAKDITEVILGKDLIRLANLCLNGRARLTSSFIQTKISGS